MHLLVHGGAGLEPDEPDRRSRDLERAAEAGVDAGTPLEAVETAVGVLESAPRFNAGVGSAIQSDGTVRTDAGVMTDDGAVGAVCSMPGVEHAVSVARIVLEETPHVFLSGEHAVGLAESYGVETGVDLRTDRTCERWAAVEPPDGDPRRHLEWVRERFGQGPDPEAATDHDTVGAVATDGERLAAATSTGGRWFALAGRVGDVPQVGAGFYCSPTAAASATGAGEDIARVTLSRRVVAGVESGLEVGEATERALEAFEDLTGSTAGVIAIDARGTAASAYNSEAMGIATADRDP